MKADADIVFSMDTARKAAQAGARAAMRWFRRPLDVETKADHTPVTRADRESEGAILAVVSAAFPNDGILAEESGTRDGRGGGRWIVDPIDGTRGFARGGSFWGPIVAREVDGVVVAGAIALPALGATYWAGRGLGAFRDGERLRVSPVTSWSEATLSLGEIRGLLDGPHGSGVLDLARGAASVRTWGDLAGAAMVLDGRAEAWIEAGVKAWDLGAFAILFEEAGGRFTDFDGAVRIDAGRAVGSNGRLHDFVLEALASRRGGQT